MRGHDRNLNGKNSLRGTGEQIKQLFDSSPMVGDRRLFTFVTNDRRAIKRLGGRVRQKEKSTRV